MTSLLIGLWVWPTVLAAQVAPKDSPPPSERAMRKRCAAVGEELIQRVHDYALTTAAGGGPPLVALSHGAVITKMRQWVKDEKLTDQLSDACLVEIVRLAYAKNVKDQKTRQEAEAKARQIATWNALNATEKFWVLRARGTAPRLTCETLAVGAVGVLKNQVNILHVDSRNGGFVIGGLMCDPIVTTKWETVPGSGRAFRGNLPLSGFRFGTGAPGSVIGTQPIEREITTTITPPDVMIYISGMDVKGLTTDTKWDLYGKPVEVIGTRTSVDALGGGTIFEVRSVSVDPVLLSTITPPPGVTIDNYKEAVKPTHPTTPSP